jgi:hypothetical protein
MYAINFIEGECGNVGKSLFAMMMAEAYQRRSKGYTLVDMDRSHPDVGQRYPRAILDIYFSPDSDDLRTDRLATLAHKSEVIVNLPLGSLQSLDRWFDLNPIDGLKVNRWFVSPLDRKSLVIFEQLLKVNKHTSPLHRLILVHNQRDGLQMSEDLSALLEESDVLVIKLPLIDLPPDDRLILEDPKNASLSPSELAQKFGRMGKMRWENVLQGMAFKIDAIAG